MQICIVSYVQAFYNKPVQVSITQCSSENCERFPGWTQRLSDVFRLVNDREPSPQHSTR